MYSYWLSVDIQNTQRIERKEMLTPRITLLEASKVFIVLILLSLFIWQGLDTVQKFRDGKTSLQVTILNSLNYEYKGMENAT